MGASYKAMVERQAMRTLGELGFRPAKLEWRGGTTFEASFGADETRALNCATALRRLGRDAGASPARFDDDAFATFVL